MVPSTKYSAFCRFKPCILWFLGPIFHASAMALMCGVRDCHWGKANRNWSPGQTPVSMPKRVNFQQTHWERKSLESYSKAFNLIVLWLQDGSPNLQKCEAGNLWLSTLQFQQPNNLEQLGTTGNNLEQLGTTWNNLEQLLASQPDFIPPVPCCYEGLHEDNWLLRKRSGRVQPSAGRLKHGRVWF